MKYLETCYINQSEEPLLYQNKTRRKIAHLVSRLGLVGAATGMCATIIARSNAGIDHFTPPVDSLQYGLLFHFGDFINGYISTLAGIRLGSLISPTSFKNRVAFAAAGTGALLLYAEIPQLLANKLPLIGFFTGTPDIADLPAGFLGIAAAATISLCSRKIIMKKRA